MRCRKNKLLLLLLLLPGMHLFSQNVATFIDELKRDKELQNASVGLSVLDSKSGETLTEYNGKLSLTPASTLKIITTAAALQLLGKDFKYETFIQYSGSFDKASGIIDGDLIIKGNGDPSLNSEYFRKADDTFFVANKWATTLKEKGVKKITGRIVLDVSCFEEDIPSTWVWGDIGNYFGAAPYGISYNDNKFFIVFKPAAKNGDSLFIGKTFPNVEGLKIENHVKAGGSDDNSSVFHAPLSNELKITGTLPASPKEQSIEASLPNAPVLLARHLQQAFSTAGIELADKTILKITASNKKQYDKSRTILHIYRSPTLDKIIFYTNLHSNNHYAESIFKAIALKKGGWGSTWMGISEVTKFLKSRGFDMNGLFINDGSGLSRSNAVKAEDLSRILFMMNNDSLNKDAFYNSLPVSGISGSLRSFGKGTVLESNLHAKSGYITRVRSYAGYMKAKSGREICLSLIVNNFNGTPTDTKKKMEEIFLKIFESY